MKSEHTEYIIATLEMLFKAFNSVCDYCEVLCEILIFSYHISVISYFLDGVHGLEHNNFF